MNKVFEEFVEARLRRYLNGRLTVHGQWPDRLDDQGAIRIRPDLVFTGSDQQVAYVADMKYKVTADGYGREADYCQLLAYTTALDVHEGLLIYCQHDGSVPMQEAHARRAGKVLRTWPLRLDRSIARLEDDLHCLADRRSPRHSLRP